MSEHSIKFDFLMSILILPAGLNRIITQKTSERAKTILNKNV